MDLAPFSVKFKDSFIEAVEEYKAVDSIERKDINKLNIKDLESDFPSYIANLLSEQEGKNFPEGYILQTTYWLIDGNDFVGRDSIHHKLTENLLKEGGHIGYDIRPSKRKMGYGKKALKLGTICNYSISFEAKKVRLKSNNS